MNLEKKVYCALVSCIISNGADADGRRAENPHTVLTTASVKIDPHFHAYYKQSLVGGEQCASLDILELTDMLHFGLQLAFIITGGAFPDGTTCSEENLAPYVLPGCHALLEALAVQCCDEQAEQRPSAVQVVHELRQLLDDFRDTGLTLTLDEDLFPDSSQGHAEAPTDVYESPDDRTLPPSVRASSLSLPPSLSPSLSPSLPLSRSLTNPSSLYSDPAGAP